MSLRDALNKKLLLSGDTLEEFQGVISALLSEQFIRRESEKEFVRYEFIRRNEEAVRELLSLCGMELRHNHDYLFYWVTTGEGKIRAELNLAETITLLILRLLYEEAMADLKVINGVASVTSREVHEKYRAFINAEKPMEKTQHKGAMSSLRRYGIVEYDGAFSLDPDFKIRVLPTILAVVDRTTMDNIAGRLKDYGKQPASDET